MHKRLFKLIALLMLPVFLVACNEHGAENKVDKDVLAATLQKAMDTAKELDNMTTKAYGMARVGAGMATIDPVKAGQALDAALDLVNQARSSKYRAVLAELRSTTADWPAAEKDQVADAIDRIEKNTTRVWVVRAIAEGMMVNDRGPAEAVLMGAAAQAAAIPDPKYRDMDMRSISALMARMNMNAALDIAGGIGDPRVKAWALIEIGETAAANNSGDAAGILRAAGEAAKSIPREIEPASALLVDDASQETKDAVLSAERAKLVATGARMLAVAAAAMSKVEPGTARMMAAEAADMASAIDAKNPYTRAYAMSDVAIEAAAFDADKAADIAEKVDAAHPDARVAAMLAVINARSGNGNSTNMLSSIEEAVNVAEGITDSYDRAKALAALAEAAIPYNKDKAVEIAGMIEEDLGLEKYGFSDIKNEVLADVAVAWTGEDDEIARKMVDPTAEEALKDHKKYIVEPRFAKNCVLRTKAGAYMAMADKKIGTDEADAMKLYNKAASTAADAKTTMLQWEVARRLCKIDGDKLFEYAAVIPAGDFSNQAMALADIASDWSGKGKTTSGMVWDMAAKAANMPGDNMESSELLNSVAAMCAKYDKDKATEIYAMSMKRIVKIGMEEG